jgi:aminomethyltransferase
VSDDLLRTPLTARHEAAGAKLAPFAGWSMPLSFAGVLAEHTAVRDDVGVFDVSHLGTVFVTGPSATAVVDRSFTADAAAVAPGTSRYTLCTAEDGGILDDLIVYRLTEERWFVVPNAANTATVVARLRDAGAELAAELGSVDPSDVPEAADLADATIEDRSTSWAVLAVQGPRSLELLAQVLGLDVAAIGWGHLQEVQLDDVAAGLQGVRLIVCRTGYTGEIGAELLVPAEHAVAVWDGIVSAGATPCGLGARDTLRLEMGYPLHGADLTPDVLPGEARMSWAVQLEDADGEPRRFPGAVALAAAKANGPARRLWGVRSGGRRPLRAGAEVRQGDRVIGRTTSGGFSPTLGAGIGLALLDAEVALGERVTVDLRGTPIEVDVVRPPFVDRDPKG